MKKLKALLLTEGMHGMISQVEGMAKALNVEYNHKIVKLSFPWNLIPPKFSPISQIVLKNKIYTANDETPDLVISCGRKSVIPSIFLKKMNSKIFTIHIQNPKVSFKNFDVIVAPEHDNLRGDNIYSSKGAIHYITEIEINNAKQYLTNKIEGENEEFKDTIICELLGVFENNSDIDERYLGPYITYCWYEDNILSRFISKIHDNNKIGYQIRSVDKKYDSKDGIPYYESVKINNDSVNLLTLNANEVIIPGQWPMDLDFVNADNRTKLAITNASNFLKMDMANLNNKQQAKVMDAQLRQQRILSDQASINAARQFNATSQNQTDQFNASMANQMEQFNTQQANSMEQFNASEKNKIAAVNAGNELDVAKFNTQISAQVDQFNETMDLNRDQWNAANRQAIEQSNTSWRRQANLVNTAAQNAVNQQNASNAFGMQTAALAAIWQQMRDEGHCT